MEMPLSNQFSVSVHGVHVVAFKRRYWSGLAYDVRSFDFSRRGCSALPLWNREEDRPERGVSFEDGRELIFQAVRNKNFLSWSDMESLSNGTFFYQVSYFTHSSGSGVVS